MRLKAAFLITLLIALGTAMIGCSDNDNLLDPTTTQVSDSLAPPDFSFDQDNVIEGNPFLRNTGVTTDDDDDDDDGDDDDGDDDDDDDEDEDSGGSGPDVYHWDAMRLCFPSYERVLTMTEGFELTVPPGAVRSLTLVTADVWVQQAEGVTEWIQFEFHPGMTFDQSLILAIDKQIAQPLVDAEGRYVLWFIEDGTGNWLVSDEGELVDGIVYFEIDHFSKYAIGR